MRLILSILILLCLTIGAAGLREVPLTYTFPSDDMQHSGFTGERLAAIGNWWPRMTAGLIVGLSCRYRMGCGCSERRRLTRMASSPIRAMNADGGTGLGLG
jgi:hypothetical protein